MRTWVYIIGCLTLLACNSGEFKQARENLRLGKYYIAIEHYIAFAKEQPKHRKAPEALLEAGNLQYAVLGEPELAVRTFEKLVQVYPVGPHTLAAQRKIAEIYKNHFSNYRQAILEYDKLLSAAPLQKDAPHIMMELAHCYTLVHDFSKAEIEYENIIRDYPKFEKLDETYFQKGNNYFISGDYEKAIRSYQNMLKISHNSKLIPQAIFGIANAYEEMDDFARAKEHYQKIIDTYPSPNVVRIRLKGVEDREKSKNSGTASNRRRGSVPLNYNMWKG